MNLPDDATSEFSAIASSPVVVYLGLGGNVGSLEEKIKIMRSAIAHLNQMPATCVRRCSSFYRNPAWGFENQADFINAAVEIETSLAPDELLKSIKEIEIQLGRKPTFRWGPRVVDIDILLYGREMIREPHLSVPHLHLLERPFAAVPLLEIAPDILLPDSRLLRNAADTDSRNLEKIGLKE